MSRESLSINPSCCKRTQARVTGLASFQVAGISKSRATSQSLHAYALRTFPGAGGLASCISPFKAILLKSSLFFWANCCKLLPTAPSHSPRSCKQVVTGGGSSGQSADKATNCSPMSPLCVTCGLRSPLRLLSCRQTRSAAT